MVHALTGKRAVGLRLKGFLVHVIFALLAVFEKHFDQRFHFFGRRFLHWWWCLKNTLMNVFTFFGGDELRDPYFMKKINNKISNIVVIYDRNFQNLTKKQCIRRGCFAKILSSRS